jgi:hypothetical protein
MATPTQRRKQDIKIKPFAGKRHEVERTWETLSSVILKLMRKYFTSALKIKATRSSEIFVTTYKTRTPQSTYSQPSERQSSRKFFEMQTAMETRN